MLVMEPTKGEPLGVLVVTEGPTEKTAFGRRPEKWQGAAMGRSVARRSGQRGHSADWEVAKAPGHPQMGMGGMERGGLECTPPCTGRRMWGWRVGWGILLKASSELQCNTHLFPRAAYHEEAEGKKASV